MAVYNEILVGRYNRFLQKVTAIKGGPPAAALGGEIMPILPLESFGVENRYLASWQRFGFFIAAAAGGVGLRSGIRFRNPAGSNVLAVFEKIRLTRLAGTADNILASYNFSPPAPVDFIVSANLQPRLDARQQVPTATLIPSSSGNVGGSTGAFFWIDLVGITGGVELIVDDDQELPVLPGDAITFWSNNLNSEIDASVIWRERFLEDSERT